MGGPTSLLPLGQWIDLEYMRLWQAALLLAALSLPIVLLGLRSLAGLGPVRRWVAVGVRLAVILVLVLLLAGLQLRQQKHDVEVVVLSDVSDSVSLYKGFPDQGSTMQRSVDEYLMAASKVNKQKDDRIGLISFSDAPQIDLIPNVYYAVNARAHLQPGGTTDIAGAINMGLAAFRNDTLHRLVLISDGNQTAGGNLDAAIEAAAAQRVPIDVMILDYQIENEVMVDRVVTGKSWRRENEPFTLDIIVKSTNTVPVTGKLTVFHVGDKTDSGKDILAQQQVVIPAARIIAGKLEPHLHVEHIAVPELRKAGVHEFRATLTDVRPVDGVAAAKVDTRADNNSGGNFVIVKGKGKVLLVDNMKDAKGNYLPQAANYLVEALAGESGPDGARQGGIDVERISLANMPQDAMRLQSYDAIILANVPRGAGGISDAQDQMLANYVHETGGGLIMLGGDETFGAGAWVGSKVEQVVPVNFDIPAQRQMPKGALVLCMHSCEMPNGNYWGEQCAIKAVEALSALDEVGVVSYNWNQANKAGVNGAAWDWPLAPKKSGAAVINAIKRMALGDAPSFDDFLVLALNGVPGQPGLVQSKASRKHIIIISDGDPQAPTPATIKALTDNKITVSTVPVFPHSRDAAGLPPTMRMIAEQTGGVAYPPVNDNPNQLPQIFIKDAMVVRRSLVQSDESGIPVKRESVTDPVVGIDAFPDLYGYVLVTRKQAAGVAVPLTVSMKASETGKMQVDPLLAHWQAGLGKAAVFTSDAHNLWAAGWVRSPMFGKFWLQLVRSVQRPAMSTDFDVQITRNGEKGRIVVEALNKDQKFLNFLNIGGSISGPDARQNVKLVQTGPGTYVAEFDARSAGNYVVVMNYSGQKKDESGWLMSGLAVAESPEMRNLKANVAKLREIATRTRGRIIPAWDPQSADLFSRENLSVDSTPLPVRNQLLILLIILLIVDVAVRRIAWEWAAIKRGLAGAGQYVQRWTLSRRVETEGTLDALKKKRDEVAETRFKEAPSTASPPPLPDKRSKFEAREQVEGDITGVVGGATTKPLPPPPKKIEPKGGPAAGAGHTGSLLEAKRRAQQKIKEKEQGEG